MVSEVIVIRDNTVILKNPAVDNTLFATFGVERICVQKRRDIYWCHILYHCYGLQVFRNGILYIDSDISYFMMGCLVFICAENQ